MTMGSFGEIQEAIYALADNVPYSRRERIDRLVDQLAYELDDGTDE